MDTEKLKAEVKRWDEKWIDFYDAHARDVNMVLLGAFVGILTTVVVQRFAHMIAGWF